MRTGRRVRVVTQPSLSSRAARHVVVPLAQVGEDVVVVEGEPMASVVGGRPSDEDSIGTSSCSRLAAARTRSHSALTR